jgi:exosortase
MAVVGLAYARTWRELWPLWVDTGATTYTHGVLIAAISLWLAWRARDRVGSLPLAPATWSVPLLGLVSLLWLVAAHGGLLVVHAALWPALAWLAVLATCGWQAAASFAFPLAFLWFAVPLWDYLVGILQAMTILVVGVLNQLTGVPSTVAGDLVILPQGTFRIAEGCSGVHFVIVALAVAALAGELRRSALPTRVLLLGLAGMLALVSNWLRVYLIILAGHLTDMQHYLVKVDHYYFGWGVFAITMLAFHYLLSRMPFPAAAGSGPPRASGAPGPPDAARRLLAGFAAALLLPAASAAAWAVLPAHQVMPFLTDAADFAGPLSPGPLWRPEYAGPRQERRAAYLSSSGRVIETYANLYLDQRQGAEVIGFGNRLFDEPSFPEQRSAVTSVDAGSGSMGVVEVGLRSRNGEPWLAMYRYYVGTAWYTSELAAQLATGLRSVLGPVPAGIQAAAARCGGDCGVTRRELGVLLAESAGVRQ